MRPDSAIARPEVLAIPDRRGEVREAGPGASVHLRGADHGQRLSPLTVMPLGVLACGVACDVGAGVAGHELFGIAAFYDIAVGLVISFVALVIVLVDLVTAPSGAAQRELVGTAAGALTLMTIVFAVVWSVRSVGTRTPVGGWLLAAEVLALAAGLAGAWLAQGVVIGRHAHEPAQVWTLRR